MLLGIQGLSRVWGLMWDPGFEQGLGFDVGDPGFEQGLGFACSLLAVGWGYAPQSEAPFVSVVACTHSR